MDRVYDFFISYNWARFAGEAIAMKGIVESRGYSAWLDVDQPFGPGCDEEGDTALGQRLREALADSRYVIFFEASMTVAAVVGGPPQRVIGWQEWELDMAEAERLIVLYHTAAPSRLAFGLDLALHPYASLDQAFGLVEIWLAEREEDL